MAILLMAMTATAFAQSDVTINLANTGADSGPGWTRDSFGLITVTGDVTITGNGGADANARRIIVPAASVVNITLDNAVMSLPGLMGAAPALRLQQGAVVNLTLTGTNSLSTDCATCAAIEVPEGASLTIGGAGSLTANARANGSAAGIGSSYADGRRNVGAITINSGTITANGGGGANAGAGIGSVGGNQAIGGSITISGGTVIANGGSGSYSGGAGIGNGSYGSYSGGGNTVIYGSANVTATGGTGAAGIGGGNVANVTGILHGSIIIAGSANVTAT